MVYIGLILWMIISSLICFGKYFNINKNRKIFVILVFVVMCLIMAFRSVDVGVDTGNYKIIFDLMKNTSFIEITDNFYTDSMEIGYALLMKVCSLICEDYYFFQVVISVLFSILAAKFILEESDNIFIGVVVFLGIGIYIIAFNVARQMLAAMIVANSWILLKKGKRNRSIVCVLVASTFHITALVFMAVYIIYFFRHNKYIIRLIPFFAVIGAINFDRILSFVAKYFTYYHNYYANEKVIQTAGFVWIIWSIVLLVAVRILYIARETNIEHSIAAIFSMIWVICNIIGLSFNYFERLGLYFISFVPVMFSFSGNYIKNRSIRWIYLNGMTVAFIIYFLLSVYSEQYIYNTFI